MIRNYQFSFNTQEEQDINFNTDKIIEVDLVKNNILLDSQGYLDSHIIDLDISGKNMSLDTDFVEYIVGKGGECRISKMYIIYQEDTSDINSATEKLKDKTFFDNDTLIISNSKNETAGYIWSEELNKWIAFSGNVSAGNALFEKDILCAGNYTQVGNVTKTLSGTTLIPAKGKTIEEVMTSIFTQELQPSKTEPSVSIAFLQAGSKEVGTTITPTYTVTLNKGSYTYDTNTGVIATSYSVTDSDSHSSTTSSGSFDSFTVTDSTNYKISASVTHTDGNIAKTNLGNDSNPIVQILSGTKTKTSSSVTGYRKLFYGVLNDLNPLTSSIIRGLTDGGAISNKTITVKVNGNTNAKRIIVAIPKSSGKKVTKVNKTDGLVTDITSTYSLTEVVSVDGCNNVNNFADYNIWTYQPASIDSAEVHEIIIG